MVRRAFLKVSPVGLSRVAQLKLTADAISYDWFCHMINDDQAGMSRVQRAQSNFDERLFAEYSAYPGSVSFLECLVPSRSPQKCERYTASELTPVHSDAVGHQVLISETSTIGDVKGQLRQLKQKRADLREEYRSDLQAEWKRLLSRYPRKVIYWKKTSTLAFRKAKWRKVPTGKSKLVVRYVNLKPRLQHVVRRGVDFGLILVRPRVRRELLVPVYQKVIVRPAGFRRITVRTKTVLDSYDWPRIRASYIVYKVNRRAQLDTDVAPLEQRINTLYKRAGERMQMPHKLVAFTSLGWIPPSWEEFYYQHFRERGHYEDVYGHMLPYEFRTGVVGRAAGEYPWPDRGFALYLMGPLFMGYKSLATSSLSELLSTVRALGVHIPVNVPESFKMRDMLHPRTVVDRLVSLDSKLNPDLRDEQLEALAASNVRTLRNGGDYVFNLPRSIGELKDSKELFRQAYDFCRWLGSGTRSRQALPSSAKAAATRVLSSTGSASLALVGAFLAWKFAIQPTIQDCVTFREHSKEWLLATRRQLMESIAILKKTSSNILHIRSKFRGDDAVRQKSLKNVISDVSARSEVVELTSWARFEPPCFVQVREELGITEPVSYSSSNESLDGFEPSYKLSATPVTGYSRYTPSGFRYTYQGELPAGSVSGTVDTSDVSVAPTSFTSTGVPLDVVDAPESEVFGLRVPTDLSSVQQTVLEDSVWPRVNTTGYVKNQVEGVVFARYQLGNLLEFLDDDYQNNSLETLLRLYEKMTDWDLILEGAYHSALKGSVSNPAIDSDEAERVLASFDTIYVAWQLTPLSFVYDWITTSESVATRLNNFLTEYSVPAPPAKEGVWVTKRVELLAGRPRLELDPEDRMSSSYVSDWYGGKMVCTCTGRIPGIDAPRTYHSESYWAFPKRVVTTHRVRYVSDTKVSLSRSGLYTVKRGEYLDGGWETFLPQVRIKLNANKVGTLLGILVGFLRPKQ